MVRPDSLPGQISKGNLGFLFQRQVLGVTAGVCVCMVKLKYLSYIISEGQKSGSGLTWDGFGLGSLSCGCSCKECLPGQQLSEGLAGAQGLPLGKLSLAQGSHSHGNWLEASVHCLLPSIHQWQLLSR